MSGSMIYIIHFTTPLGSMCAGASDQGICLLDFDDKNRLDTELEDLCQKLNTSIVSGAHTFL